MSNKKSTAKANFAKTSRSQALVLGARFQQALSPLCKVVTLAGSLRQEKDMVGDIDVVVVPKSDPATFLEEVKSIIEYEYGGTKKIFGMFGDRPINIFVTNDTSYGATLYQASGPYRYNLVMRARAKKLGMKLNEYGLWNRITNEYIAGASEEDIFIAMGMKYRSPELRK